MITFFILLVTLLSLAVAAALIVGAGGLAFLLTFGDLIVCVIIVWAIIRMFINRRR